MSFRIDLVGAEDAIPVVQQASRLVAQGCSCRRSYQERSLATMRLRRSLSAMLWSAIGQATQSILYQEFHSSINLCAIQSKLKQITATTGSPLGVVLRRIRD